MTRRATVAALAALLVVSTAFSGAAVAAEDDPFGGLITVDDSGVLTDIDIKFTAITSGLARTVEAYTSDAGQASTYAEDWTSAFNANNETIEAYANERLNASADYDVLAVHFHDRDGNNVTRYFVADVQNDNWTNSRFVTSTSRSVDHHVIADWYVSKHAADELETFVEDYAEPNKPLSLAYKTKMVAQYGDGLQSSIWNGSGS